MEDKGAFVRRMYEDFGEALTNKLRGQLLFSYHIMQRGRRHRFVKVNLKSALSGDDVHQTRICKDWRLRDVQAKICRLFGKSFPATKAALVINGKRYTSFLDRPFTQCEPGSGVQVMFSATNDPYFYDWQQRRSRKLGEGLHVPELML